MKDTARIYTLERDLEAMEKDFRALRERVEKQGQRIAVLEDLVSSTHRLGGPRLDDADIEEALRTYVEADECEYYGMLDAHEVCPFPHECLRCRGVLALNPHAEVTSLAEEAAARGEG